MGIEGNKVCLHAMYKKNLLDPVVSSCSPHELIGCTYSGRFHKVL
jgi:hypothetical protein